MRPRFHPTGRALVLASLGLVLAVLSVVVSSQLAPLWVVFWIVFALALAVDFLRIGSGRHFRASLSLPPTLPVGRECAVPLRIEETRGKTHLTDLAISLSADLDPIPQTRVEIAEGRADLLLPMRVQRRGRVRVHSVHLRYRGPFGLVQCTVILALGAESVGVPDIAPVQEAAIRFFGSSDFRSGLKIERILGEGSEFESLREYLPGHDPRVIDWKASARHKRLFVRQFRAERNHQILLGLDVGRLMGEPLAGIPKLDHAVHAALLLGYVGLRTGDRVGSYAFDSQFRGYFPPRSGVHAFPALRAQVASLEYGHDETNFTLGLTDLAGRLDRRSLVVVLSDFVDAVTAELMVENLDRLARRHLVIFVALRDPLFGEVTRRSPRTAGDVHRAAVLQGMVQEREKVLRRLRRSGIVCIDAEPLAVRTQLLNRYLDVKRRERIA